MENQPIKILFLASEPSNEARLRLGEEFREIQSRLDDRNRFDLESSWAVRPRDVLLSIFKNKPQVVHFAGHGAETGELCLEDNQGKTQRVKPAALSALFKEVKEHVKCVVINSCYAKEQADAIAEHVPFVVGTRKAIGDKAAIEFATGFYGALGVGLSIEEIEQAFNWGRVAIQLNNDSILQEHLTPVLVLGDPRNRFREEVEKAQTKLQITNSASTKITLRALRIKGERMGLSMEDIELTINEALQQIEEVQQRLQEYEKVYKEAVRDQFSLSEETREALRYLQSELGLQDADVATIERKINEDKDNWTPEEFFDSGLTNYRLGDYQRALNFFTWAIERRANYSGAYLERGFTYYKLGDERSAIEDYDRAIEINNNWDGRTLSSAYFERGFAYFYLARKENHSQNMQAAIENWTKTIELRENYSIAHYNRALAYAALDDRDEAIKDYTRAIEINSDWGTITPAHAYYRRGLLLQATDNVQAATQDFQKAVELLKTKPEYQSLFAGYSDVLRYLEDVSL